MWPSYERCKDLSCHAAELSYEFSVEKTLNCPRLSEDKNGMATCQPDGALLKPDMVEMEKMYHAYLANFMHNSDPNNGTGVKISQNMQLVRFSSSDAPWYQLELVPSEIGRLCAHQFLRGVPMTHTS